MIQRFLGGKMLRNNLLISFIMLCITLMPAYSEELKLKDLTLPKPPAYRVGLSSSPEQQFIQAIEDATKTDIKYALNEHDNDVNSADLTYADLSLKRLSKEISQELQYEEKTMVADLSLLWQGAATQSDTINFALYKLANPDADKPDEKSVKKVLTTIASMSTLVGAGVGSPIIAGSSLIGGNILGIMGQDTKALNYKYTKVSDADMIILIRKVEDLQQKAIDLYYDYMCAKRRLEFMNDLVADRQQKFELAQKNNAARELIVITDAYYRTALDRQRSAKSDFFSKRAALEQFVGNETFVQFEEELMAREKGDAEAIFGKNPMPEADENEYKDTVQAVEKYTDNANHTDKVQKTDIKAEDTSDNSEGGFYSNFPTGFAAPTTLEEFLNPEIIKKPKKEKTVKPKKEKVAKTKSVKVAKPKKEKLQKVKKEKTDKLDILRKKLDKINHKDTQKEQDEPFSQVKKQDETTSWYESWANEIKEEKLQEKQLKKEAKAAVKKEKRISKKEKKFSKKAKTKDKLPNEELINNEISTEENPQEEISPTENNETNVSENAEEEISKKGKLNKIRKPKKEKAEKPKKPKKEKDLYPELHGQKPIHTYPRNSEKDLIFLHGRDKHEAKKPSEMTEEEKKELKARNIEYLKHARERRRAERSQELLDEASLKPMESKPARAVRMSPTAQQGQPYLRYDEYNQDDDNPQVNTGEFTLWNRKPKSSKHKEKQVKSEPVKQTNNIQPANVSQPVRVQASDYKNVYTSQPARTQNSSIITSPSTQSSRAKTSNTMYTPASSTGVNAVNPLGPLLPLDDIKAPDLTKGGYSIHSN